MIVSNGVIPVTGRSLSALLHGFFATRSMRADKPLWPLPSSMTASWAASLSIEGLAEEVVGVHVLAVWRPTSAVVDLLGAVAMKKQATA